MCTRVVFDMVVNHLESFYVKSPNSSYLALKYTIEDSTISTVALPILLSFTSSLVYYILYNIL